MSTPRYDLHIDRLRVPGIDPHQHDALHEAIEQELRRLAHIAGPPRHVTSGSTRAPGGTVRAPRGAGPVELGVHIARFIHASLGGRLPLEDERS